ncbi:hypothetical protein Dxin01_00209 [Deinococcus xinjiangensis]|uniref:Uncharacterized protein n=1 Tax=Deinococcus xinjiangensis TaxID=457454 RepID=A0ABP9V5C6_9DEIO
MSKLAKHLIAEMYRHPVPECVNVALCEDEIDLIVAALYTIRDEGHDFDEHDRFYANDLAARFQLLKGQLK